MNQTMISIRQARRLPWMARLLALASMLLASGAWANCYQVNYTTGNQPDNYTIQPSDGVAGYWYPGASNGSQGSFGASGIINVTSDTNFQPIGTVLTTGVAPFSQWGKAGGYNPEQILFRCAAADGGQIFELYATHGNERYAEAWAVPGVANTYYTDWTNVGIRIKNMSDGNYFSRTWQTRSLTNLDRDTRGFLLVKAKNLLTIQVELVRVDNGSTVTGSYFGYSKPYTTNATGSYPANYALAYVGFVGPGLPGPTPGADSYTNGANQWGYNEGTWPGGLTLGGFVNIRRSSTCSVTNVTPVVQFPNISVNELNGGGSRSQNFALNFNCQTGAITNSTYADTSSGNGVAPNAGCGWNSPNSYKCVTSSGVALGVLPSTGAVAAAQRFTSLKTSGTGLLYLLSDQYPATGVNNGVARGVGIQIYRMSSPGTAMNLASVDNTTGNTSKTSDATANLAGWYKAVDTSTNNLGGNNYSETFQAVLKKLPAATGETVAPGQVRSTARVLIRVQ